SAGRPSRRRRSRRRVRTRRIGTLVAILVVGMAAAGIGVRVAQAPQPDPSWPVAENIVVPASAVVSDLEDQSRPNFRYSVVAGGVHAPSEMRQAIERDSVVAAHYAGLDPD